MRELTKCALRRVKHLQTSLAHRATRTRTRSVRRPTTSSRRVPGTDREDRSIHRNLKRSVSQSGMVLDGDSEGTDAAFFCFPSLLSCSRTRHRL